MRGRSKYGAQKTRRGSRTYDSKAEARYADRLKLAKRSGKLVFWLEQVPFRLECGASYKLDFLEFWATDDPDCFDIRAIDVKSAPTAAKESFRLKRKQVELEFPFRIECRDSSGRPVDPETKQLDAEQLQRRNS